MEDAACVWLMERNSPAILSWLHHMSVPLGLLGQRSGSDNRIDERAAAKASVDVRPC